MNKIIEKNKSVEINKKIIKIERQNSFKIKKTKKMVTIALRINMFFFVIFLI